MTSNKVRTAHLRKRVFRIIMGGWLFQFLSFLAALYLLVSYIPNHKGESVAQSWNTILVAVCLVTTCIAHIILISKTRQLLPGYFSFTLLDYLAVATVVFICNYFGFLTPEVITGLFGYAGIRFLMSSHSKWRLWYFVFARQYLLQRSRRA